MAHNTTGGVPKEVLAEREAQVWALRRQGYTHERIAAELGLERSTVSKMLTRLTKRANTHLEEEIVEVKLAQIGQLQYIADEALQAWHKSKEAQKSVAKRTLNRPNRFGRGQPEEEMTIQTEDQDGNPRYLEAARGAMGDLRKLLGLDAPARSEITGKGGGPVQLDVTKLTDEELLAVIESPGGG